MTKKEIIAKIRQAVREQTIREVLDEIDYMKEAGFEIDYEIEFSIKNLTKKLL